MTYDIGLLGFHFIRYRELPTMLMFVRFIPAAVSVPRQGERGAVHEARARLPRLRRRHGERQRLLEDRRDGHGRARQVQTKYLSIWLTSHFDQGSPLLYRI